MQKPTSKPATWLWPSNPGIKFLFAAQLAFLLCFAASAQKQAERLGRGVVAVRTSTSQVYISWRLLGTEPANIGFNLYRGSTKVNASPITAGTNYVDNVSTNSTYTVRPVISGTEQAASTGATVWSQQFLEVGLQRPAGGTTPDGVAYTYSPNDCSPGDLDGDGEYEIVVKWDPSNSKDNSQAGYTGNVFIDGYKLNGTRLWRIDLGRNIRAGAHYTQLMVYDLDGDGRAEIACKTADGTRSGTGQVIGSSSADYRNSGGYILTGPEFLTVFSGQTGAALSTVNYLPARGSVSSWGDGYGNRVDRFVATVAYLDGARPSLVMGRGYYTRLVRAAWDFRNGTLTNRWVFDSNNSGNGAYAGEGNHQMTVGDTDGDGKDEVFNGSSAINDNGTGMWVTGLGHGDALHLSNINPNRTGQEVWMCHEEASGNGGIGLSLTDARTGARIWTVPGSGDVGRAMTADIDSRYVGMECWGSAGGLYTCTGTQITTTKPSVNFGLWWDGDVQRELLDGTKLDKWNSSNNTVGRLFTFYNYGTATQINGTKANPNLSADILGDWREEVIYHSSDNTKLLVFTTVTPASNRYYTFMHDVQYRCQVAQQNSAYNQPPHTSFYFGGGMAAPPTPNIYLTGSGGGSTGAIANGTYTIIARHSGKAVEVAGGSTADGANVQQWTAGTGNYQQWTVTALSGGYYSIINVRSGKAMEVEGSSTANNGNIIQYTYSGGANQQWTINNLGGGYYNIINRNSGLAADVAARSTADGANVAQYAYSGGTNQQFTLEAPGSRMAGVSAEAIAIKTRVAENDKATIYPNPSPNIFNLSVAGKFTYSITDQSGKILETGKGDRRLNVGASLLAGMYYININREGKLETLKMTKQ